MYMRAGYSMRQGRCYREYNMLDESRASLQRACRHFGLDYPSGSMSSIVYNSTVLLPRCNLGSCWGGSNEDTSDDCLRVSLLTDTIILELQAGKPHVAVCAILRGIELCKKLGDDAEVELAFFYMGLALTFGSMNLIDWSKFYFQKCRELASDADLAARAGWIYYVGQGQILLLYPEVDAALDVLDPAFDQAVAREDQASITFVGLTNFCACMHACEHERMGFITERFMACEEAETTVK